MSPVLAAKLAAIPTDGGTWRSPTMTTPSGTLDALRDGLAKLGAEVGPMLGACERDAEGRWHFHGAMLTSRSVHALKSLWRRFTGASRRALRFRRSFRGYGQSEKSRAKLPRELTGMLNYALKGHGAESRIVSNLSLHKCEECRTCIAHKRSHAKHCDRCKAKLKKRRQRARRRAEAEQGKRGTLLEDLRRLGGDVIDEMRRRLRRLAPLAISASLCSVAPPLMVSTLSTASQPPPSSSVDETVERGARDQRASRRATEPDQPATPTASNAVRRRVAGHPMPRQAKPPTPEPRNALAIERVAVIHRRPPGGLSRREVALDLLSDASQEVDPVVASGLLRATRAAIVALPSEQRDGLASALADVATTVEARAREATRVASTSPA